MQQLDLKLSIQPEHLDPGRPRVHRGFSRGAVFLTLLALCWAFAYLAARLLMNLFSR
ncbi:MAG: hypothetical protein ABI885_10620 [Gammaproteobacteria bacterium]